MSSDLNLSTDQINCSFIAEKFAKIRFIHEKYKQSDTFVTGGWGSNKNAVTLWKLAKEDLSGEETDLDYTPKSISKILIDGDVTGLEFFNSESIACSTTANNGISLHIYSIISKCEIINLFICSSINFD